MSLFKTCISATLLSVLAVVILATFSASPAQATVYQHSPADYCTNQEYIALGGNAAAVGIECRSTVRKRTLGQIRQHNTVVAYRVETCSYREHNGDWHATAAGGIGWEINKNRWTRFSAKRCSTKRVSPSGRVASTRR